MEDLQIGVVGNMEWPRDFKDVSSPAQKTTFHAPSNHGRSAGNERGNLRSLLKTIMDLILYPSRSHNISFLGE